MKLTLKLPIRWQQTELQEAPWSIRGISPIANVLSRKLRGYNEK